MASSWLKSWGFSWGNSWGKVNTNEELASSASGKTSRKSTGKATHSFSAKMLRQAPSQRASAPVSFMFFNEHFVDDPKLPQSEQVVVAEEKAKPIVLADALPRIKLSFAYDNTQINALLAQLAQAEMDLLAKGLDLKKKQQAQDDEDMQFLLAAFEFI